MSVYRVVGGNRLTGDVMISGSKNAALGILAAAVMVDGVSTIENLPRVKDVRILLEIIEDLGAQVEWLSENTVRINPQTINTWEAVGSKVRKIRGSYYLLGAFLAKCGKVKLDMPGGCNFGSRPIDFHLKGFAAMGANMLEQVDGLIYLDAPHLHGAGIFLDQVSVGATINIMLAAAKADGITVIDNAAKEPHIVDVANFLNTMGADVRGAGTDVIKITGKPFLPADATYTIIPDQIEAGTYMMLAALNHGDITVHNVIPKHMEPLSAKLSEMGALVSEQPEAIRVSMKPEDHLLPTSFRTMPYPGFPTDLQPQATALLCGAEGTGRVIENVWENRFQYIDDLKRMGANIFTSGKLAVIQGGTKLTGGHVRARDLRAGAALVMAGLCAQGTTIVNNAYAIERGYEDFVEKIRSIGGDITKEESATESQGVNFMLGE